MKIFYKIVLIPILVLTTSCVIADSKKSKERTYSIAIEGETIKLTKLLDRVSENENKKFLLHHEARVDVVAYGINEKTISYDELLQVISLNKMAAIDVDGYINIVPKYSAKRLAIPAITNNSVIENDALWVSKVIDGGQLDVAHLMPILRTLVSTQGHFARHHQTNSFLIVAPNAIVKRIEAILEQFKLIGKSKEISA